MTSQPNKFIKNFACLYQNCRSIRNKINELDIQILDLNPDLVLLSETWLEDHNTHLNQLNSSRNFHILIANRDHKFKSKGGGVAMLIRKGISYKQLALKNIIGIDIIAIEFSVTSVKDCIRLILVYRPPSISNSLTNKLLKNLQSLCEGNVIIVGDFNFNFKDINWDNNTAHTKCGKEFLEFTNNFKFSNTITSPTHNKGSILDLLLTNNPSSISSCQIGANLSTSDHFSILFTLKMAKPKPQKIYCRDYSKLNLLNTHLISHFNRIYEKFYDEAKCNLFASVFARSFSNLPTFDPPELTPCKFINALDDIEFSLLDIDNILKNLPNNNCCAEDGISYTLLKACHSSITPFLSDIFRLSLDTGILPQSWKVSYITPVFKKGDKNNAENYRPISITSTICRVLERIILNSLLIHLEENNIISESQFGFLKKRSTTTQLIFTFSHWYRAVLESKNVDCAYIDLKHAFDSVPIRFLLYKLFNIGIRGKLLNWISAFLTNRTAKVKINNTFSTSFQIHSGVPQGSILGPILFLIYINDITCVIPDNINKCLFADDLKIFQVFKNTENTNSLQNALNNVYQWSSDWALEISIQKTSILHIGSKNPKYTYTLKEKNLQITSTVKDLGITFTNDLSFDLHCSIIIRKAYARAISILNYIHTSNPKVWALAFKSYVRPLLEYATVIWSPKTKYLIEKIEKIQKWYTRIALSKCKIIYKNYSERLITFNLESLALRRSLYDLTMIYRIIFKFTHLSSTGLFELNERPTRNKHKFQIKVQRKNSKTEHWLCNRAVNLWNLLPTSIIDSSNPRIFWNSLRSYLINLENTNPCFIYY
uniref:Reverse transcriptase domain-containing protein n=1 Tax=Meloidogyne enterolobii TaxID=390850 RepID=A0A6V7W5V4_MELEN|nr:unnamed protein product [Meloidogyne enterolobii]